MKTAQGDFKVELVRSVQGQLMKVFQQVMQKQLTDKDEEIYSSISSRTDSGVHALNNAMVIDLPDRKLRGEIVPHDFVALQTLVNKELGKRGEAIRVQNIQRVRDKFSSYKRPYRRQYIYRLGIIKDSAFSTLDLSVPVIDKEFTHFVNPPFDMDTFLEAAECLCGTHNYTNFTSRKHLRKEHKDPVKTLHIHVKRGSPIIGDIYQELEDKIAFWDVYFTSKSFLYKQIRRLMQAMAQVAEGRSSINDLKLVLDNPDNMDHSFIHAFPPMGLFLRNVEYHPQDLKYLGPQEELLNQYRQLTETLEIYVTNQKQEVNSQDNNYCDGPCIKKQVEIF